MYARFLRWASDRLDENGVIAFVSNNSFINSKTFDGFRKVVKDEFNYLYIINLKGDARTSGEQRKREGGNVFDDQIRVGVAIYFLVKKRGLEECQIFYDEVGDFAKAEEKIGYISDKKLNDFKFERITPDKNNNWIKLADTDFETLLPLADKAVKSGQSNKALFSLFSLGVVTARDEWVYDNEEDNLTKKIKFLINVYNKDLNLYKGKASKEIKDLVDYSIKWTRAVKNDLSKGRQYSFNEKLIVDSVYRPFVKRKMYFSKELNEMQYQQHNIYPVDAKSENRIICVNVGNKVFNILASKYVPDYHFNGDANCLPFYRYDANGNKIENITDWGLNQFTKQYGTKKISKEDIFHYTYAVLHYPVYRAKYELNLKREFPRIPFYEDFKQWAAWGKALMSLHIDYETVKPFALKVTTTDTKGSPKAKLKADKESGLIIIDENTALSGIPPEAWEYKLGNRSALEWVLDQYKVGKIKDPTIAAKFDTYLFADYKTQVLDLLRRVCTVSVETMKIIKEMPQRL
jgi:predicted helicase